MKPILDPGATEFIAELQTSGPVIKKKFSIDDYDNAEAAFNAAKAWVSENLTNSLLSWRIEDDVSIRPILESRQDFTERP